MRFERVSNILAVGVAIWIAAAGGWQSSAQTKIMDFRLLPCGYILSVPQNCIFADGEIAASTPQDFAALLGLHLLVAPPIPPYTTVVLNSPGGNLGAGMELGEKIRTNRFATEIGRPGGAGVQPGVCYSACTFAFLGGIARQVRPESVFGVHRFTFAKQDTNPK